MVQSLKVGNGQVISYLYMLGLRLIHVSKGALEAITEAIILIKIPCYVVFWLKSLNLIWKAGTR